MKTSNEFNPYDILNATLPPINELEESSEEEMFFASDAAPVSQTNHTETVLVHTPPVLAADHTATTQSQSTGKSLSDVIFRFIAILGIIIFGLAVVWNAVLLAVPVKQGHTSKENATQHHDVIAPQEHTKIDNSSNEQTTSEDTTQATQPTESTYVTLKQGDRSDDVMRLQIRLKKLGYSKGNSCTGYYGSFTKTIVTEFQQKAGLPATGEADAATLEKLYAEDAPRK